MAFPSREKRAAEEKMIDHHPLLVLLEIARLAAAFAKENKLSFKVI